MPVALNLYEIREAQDAAGEFFRAVYKQTSNQYQGLWIVSAEGKVLASHQQMNDYRDWSKNVLADLDRGLKVFGPVKPRKAKRSEPLPYRGLGLRKDGGVTLAVANKFVPPRGPAADLRRAEISATTLDSIRLTASEWAQLSPTKTAPGSHWAVADATARNFFPLLNVGERYFRHAKEVTAVELTGKVERVDGAIAYLSYHGDIAGIHAGTQSEGKAGNECRSKAKLIAGTAVYDTKALKMLALTLVFDGLHNGFRPYDEPPGKFGAVVEWRLTAK